MSEGFIVYVFKPLSKQKNKITMTNKKKYMILPIISMKSDDNPTFVSQEVTLI